MIRFLLAFLLIPIVGVSQVKKDYQALLWEISGNGLEKPSYLYGTMHVSNRVAFHLGDDFFDALEQAEYIALETNPGTWVEDLTTSLLYHNSFDLSYQYNSSYMPLYGSFVPKEPQQQDWEYYLSRDQDMLNSLLYRLDQYNQDFAENTYLDLFLYQVGMKKNKQIVALEDYELSYKQVLLADKRDKDAVYMTDRQAKELLGDFDDFRMLQEDAYRRADLDLIDTINSVLSPGKYYRKYMLDIRNQVMVRGMDSLMKHGVVFTGVGAAHLPGKMGVINLLREKGYTLKPISRTVTETEMKRKDEIDEILYKAKLQNFTSDDGFISTVAPGKLTKYISQPYQEYVFADMANGGFYSIKRVSTYAPVYGKDENFFLGKIDSLLFENIPGKILSKEKISISNYPALDIQNETRSGNKQHYQIVFTPLEVIIFKVGGNDEFANSQLPQAFFKNIALKKVNDSEIYTPRFNGFKVKLPGTLRTEEYEAAFENPRYTFWAQSFDQGEYYAASLRQYHDFDYLEEDAFELSHMVEMLAEEKKLSLDTLYTNNSRGDTFSVFTLSNKVGGKLFGEVHIQGPKYVMLLTNAIDYQKRSAFYESFQFTPWKYEDTFREFSDSVYHVSMKSPMDINNYENFLNELNEYEEENDDFEGKYLRKTLTYSPTGEQIEIRLKVLPKYESFKSLDAFWDDVEKPLTGYREFTILKDSVYFIKTDSNYLSQGKVYEFSIPNSNRIIQAKMIVENGALYSLWVTSDTRGYQSDFAQNAFETFRPNDDTIIGLPITTSKANLFFEALDSGDSTQIYEASNSVKYITFEESDAKNIHEYFVNYKDKNFEKSARLTLLNKLYKLSDKENIPFLKEVYYQNLDSSTYQFKVLETLLDFNTKKGHQAFLDLIMDEPPFTSNTYSYSQLFREFQDSLNLAPKMFPDILYLTDFEDYRSNIYELLSDLLDSGLVSSRDYSDRYKSILLFAKVALKKQNSSDESRSRYGYSNKKNNLKEFTNLLTPYARKSDVKEHFKKVLKIKNESILADLVVDIDPHWEVPDSTWNHLAKDPKAYFRVLPYLRKVKKTNLLEDKYLSREEIAKSILLSKNYSSYDSVSFVKSEKVEIKGHHAEVFFYQAKKDNDKLWKMLYVVVDDKDPLLLESILTKTAESFNENTANTDEIIDDALVEIKKYKRKRVVIKNNYY